MAVVEDALKLFLAANGTATQRGNSTGAAMLHLANNGAPTAVGPQPGAAPPCEELVGRFQAASLEPAQPRHRPVYEQESYDPPWRDAPHSRGPASGSPPQSQGVVLYLGGPPGGRASSGGSTSASSAGSTKAAPPPAPAQAEQMVNLYNDISPGIVLDVLSHYRNDLTAATQCLSQMQGAHGHQDALGSSSSSSGSQDFEALPLDLPASPPSAALQICLASKTAPQLSDMAKVALLQEQNPFATEGEVVEVLAQVGGDVSEAAALLLAHQEEQQRLQQEAADRRLAESLDTAPGSPHQPSPILQVASTHEVEATHQVLASPLQPRALEFHPSHGRFASYPPQCGSPRARRHQAHSRPSPPRAHRPGRRPPTYQPDSPPDASESEWEDASAFDSAILPRRPGAPSPPPRPAPSHRSQAQSNTDYFNRVRAEQFHWRDQVTEAERNAVHFIEHGNFQLSKAWEGKAHDARDKMHACARRASAHLAHRANATSINLLNCDCHGQHLWEAKGIVGTMIKNVRATIPGPTDIKVVTGRGNNSPGQVARLKPGIEKLLQDLGEQYSELEGGGGFVVHIRPQTPLGGL